MTLGEPANLAQLIKWYRSALADEVPMRLHQRAIDSGGAPDWHHSFKGWLTDHPAATDMDGHVRHPIKFWLWVMSRQGTRGQRRADYLFRLACLNFDWRSAAPIKMQDGEHSEDMAHAYADATLRSLWRMAQHEPRRDMKRPSVVC